MRARSKFLVFGATGGTGRHFVSLALQDGHQVRALARTPAKIDPHPLLEVHQGSITEPIDLDSLLDGIDCVVAMLGDVSVQRTRKINSEFVSSLVPAMRRRGVKRFLYQAGGLSRPHGGRLSPVLWIIRHTLARSFIGQHQDNEAVMRYLAEDAADIEWIVHRAGIYGDGPFKGRLERSKRKFSVATFRDCAAYNYRVLGDPFAIHTSDFSCYIKP